MLLHAFYINNQFEKDTGTVFFMDSGSSTNLDQYIKHIFYSNIVFHHNLITYLQCQPWIHKSPEPSTKNQAGCGWIFGLKLQRCGIQKIPPDDTTYLQIMDPKCQIHIYIYMGASQNRRSGASSGTTPVPYPRSIPPWRIRSIPLFHTSDPYVIIYINICLYNYYIYIYICTIIYIYIWLCAIWFYICTHIYEHTYIHECIHAEYVYYAQALWLCWQVCACSTYSCYLLCCVMVGMCLAAASWQSTNGLLVTLPPSQPVARLCLHHLKLLQAVAQLWCLIVEMRLAAASWQSKNGLLVSLPPSQPVAGLCLHHLKLLQAVAQLWCLIVEMRLAAWQSKNCLLRYSRSKLRILIKMCCVVAVLCWSGPFRSRPRSIPVPDLDHPCTTPDPLLNTWQVLT